MVLRVVSAWMCGICLMSSDGWRGCGRQRAQVTSTGRRLNVAYVAVCVVRVGGGPKVLCDCCLASLLLPELVEETSLGEVGRPSLNTAKSGKGVGNRRLQSVCAAVVKDNRCPTSWVRRHSGGVCGVCGGVAVVNWLLCLKTRAKVPR